jgi:hypothetical protein
LLRFLPIQPGEKDGRVRATKTSATAGFAGGAVSPLGRPLADPQRLAALPGNGPETRTFEGCAEEAW